MIRFLSTSVLFRITSVFHILCRVCWMRWQLALLLEEPWEMGRRPRRCGRR
jgi:hypothetical protein